MLGRHMATEYAFFAQRLGYRDVDCKENYALKSCGVEDLAGAVPPKEKRRRRSIARREHTRCSGHDNLDSSQTHLSAPTADQARQIPSIPSHIHSNSCSASASLLQCQRASSQALLQSQQASGTLSSAKPNRPTPCPAAATNLAHNVTVISLDVAGTSCEELGSPEASGTRRGSPRPYRKFPYEAARSMMQETDQPTRGAT